MEEMEPVARNPYPQAGSTPPMMLRTSSWFAERPYSISLWANIENRVKRMSA
jgi:hypothetical protein